jgi:hypothetical protein
MLHIVKWGITQNIFLKDLFLKLWVLQCFVKQISKWGWKQVQWYNLQLKYWPTSIQITLFSWQLHFISLPFLQSHIKLNVKFTLEQATKAQRGSRGPYYCQERPSIHCIGGWVSPRAGLDGCGKSRPPLGFNPRSTQSVASHYTDWAIPAHSLI